MFWGRGSALCSTLIGPISPTAAPFQPSQSAHPTAEPLPQNNNNNHHQEQSTHDHIPPSSLHNIKTHFKPRVRELPPSGASPKPPNASFHSIQAILFPGVDRDPGVTSPLFGSNTHTREDNLRFLHEIGHPQTRPIEFRPLLPFIRRTRRCPSNFTQQPPVLA